MDSVTLTNVSEGEALEFPWGAIKWLCNDQIHPEAEMTFGIVYINAGEGNPLHYHPNCEELIYVLSGQCDHRLGDETLSLKEGMMLRIPQGIKHNAVNTGWQPVTMVICYSAADRQTIFCEDE